MRVRYWPVDKTDYDPHYVTTLGRVGYHFVIIDIYIIIRTQLHKGKLTLNNL